MHSCAKLLDANVLKTQLRFKNTRAIAVATNFLHSLLRQLPKKRGIESTICCSKRNLAAIDYIAPHPLTAISYQYFLVTSQNLAEGGLGTDIYSILSS